MSDFIQGAAGLLGAIEERDAIKAQQERDAKREAFEKKLKLKQSGLQEQEIKDPETGETRIELVPSPEAQQQRQYDQQKRAEENKLRSQRD